MRHVAVRKILKARRQVRTLDIIVATSFALAFVGIGLYVFVYSSDVILMEAFVWLSEALSFLGLMFAFHIAASRALSYRARYEFLRLESLSTLFASVIAMGMTGLVVYKAVAVWDVKPTPIALAAYPLVSAATSFALERRLSKAFENVELRLVSIRAVARKLGLDVLFEAAGGVAIIASNVLHNIVAEKVIVLATAAYVYYGLAGLAYEATMYLLGVGPPAAVRRTRRDVERVVRRFFGRPPALMRVETFGSFSEVEVWIEASPSISLENAYRISMDVAREIVRRVPEVIRAIVLVVPWPRPPPGRLRASLARGLVGSRARRPRPHLASYARRRRAPEGRPVGARPRSEGSEAEGEAGGRQPLNHSGRG